MNKETKECLIKCKKTMQKGIHDIEIALSNDKPTEAEIKLVCENITAMGDGMLSWENRYNYNMKMINSLLK